MSIYVFTGPTLSAEEGRAELEATYLPPVSQGDVYRVSLQRPRAIGIIDGYFERMPAVWHKEILWAIKEGIHVFGSASIGALRAAELEEYGMVGLGAVFQAYRNGTLESDDEVAVAHGLAENHFRATSTALVNIRCTLAEAAGQGILQPATRIELERIGRSMFYPERAYPLLLRRAVEEGLPIAELNALREWLPGGRIDQKREDALAMLRHMRDWLAGNPPPLRVTWSFEYTELWDQARHAAGELQIAPEVAPEMVPHDLLLDEVGLQGEAYAESCYRQALLRFLALEQARRQRFVVCDELLVETAEAFRRERGLFEPEALAAWLLEQQLAREEFLRLLDDEARLRWVERVARVELRRLMSDCLRLRGDYSRLLARARSKERRLAEEGLLNPTLADVGLTREDLARWFFCERLGRAAEPDLEEFSWTVGFGEEEACLRAVLREYCYEHGHPKRLAGTPLQTTTSAGR
jgi:hypothetical protein